MNKTRVVCLNKSKLEGNVDLVTNDFLKTKYNQWYSK